MFKTGQLIDCVGISCNEAVSFNIDKELLLQKSPIAW
jgi:hypothetical protein